MRSCLTCIILLGLICLRIPSKAGDIQIDRKFKSVILNKQIEIFEDASKQLTYTEVLQKKFSRNTKSTLNIGFTNSYYWVRFNLKNIDSVKIRLSIEVSNPHLNKLQIFYKDEKGMLHTFLTGDHFPFSQRPFIHPHFVFPIELNPGQSTEYYLWVDKHGEQLQIPLELWEEKEFSTYSDKLFLFLGLMLGISSLYCILSLLTYIFFRERITLIYWLYTTAIWIYLVAHTGLGFEFIWQESTWWASAARPTSSLLFYAFALLFTHSFFNIKQNYPSYDILIKALLIIEAILILALWSQNPYFGLFKNYWYNSVYYEGSSLLFYMKAFHLLALPIVSCMPFIGFHTYLRTKKSESLWFTIGFFMLLLAGIEIIAVHAGYLPDNYITQNFPLVTNALEVIIISFLLANRYKNIHIQNAKISGELAEQRQSNTIQLLEGQMVERKRLSQELHDGISLVLANVRLRLSMLIERHPSKEMHDLVDKLGQVGQDVRQFSQALSPVILERHGLVDAIEELIHTTHTSQPKLAIEFIHETVQDKNLHPLISQTIYLITLELLNNILRHSKAKHTLISLKQTKDNIILKVTDDGIGYETNEQSGGIGIQNIRARTQSLNGKFLISRQREGMFHLIQIPIQTKLFS